MTTRARMPSTPFSLLARGPAPRARETSIETSLSRPARKEAAMALSVKAAMLLCMGFIGAISWVANQVERPRIGVTSPLTVGTPVDFARALGAAATLTEGDADRRAAWVRRFERPNALDAQAATNRAADVALAVWSPEAPVAEGAPPATLPPLVGLELSESLAAAEPGGPVGDIPVAAEIAADAGDMGSTASVSDRPPARSYRVARGDTLSGIARRHWNSDDRRLVAALVTANPQLADRRGGRILVGEELRIPDLAQAAGSLPASEAAGAVPLPATGGEQWYTIRRNDTLADIAQRFLNDSGRWREIAELNGLKPHKIVPGTRIKLPPVIRLARG